MMDMDMPVTPLTQAVRWLLLGECATVIVLSILVYALRVRAAKERSKNFAWFSLGVGIMAASDMMAVWRGWDIPAKDVHVGRCIAFLILMVGMISLTVQLLTKQYPDDQKKTNPEA